MSETATPMDCRFKPGNDNVGVHAGQGLKT